MALFQFNLTLETNESEVILKSIVSDNTTRYEAESGEAPVLCDDPYEFNIQVFMKEGQEPAQHIHQIIVSQNNSGEIIE